ncbi:unnamed protein product [Notodromas monacha]|uniref:Uncharacterized protein n=1 Tax=Notodromas monacha TaxID=399045 RepID=A0A7R9BKC8_9CRUS|nr:unnamed protein product [Notodromas monacha]CAG0915731.1 unnamed protein product [Notodromas monacha]
MSPPGGRKEGTPLEAFVFEAVHLFDRPTDHNTIRGRVSMTTMAIATAGDERQILKRLFEKETHVFARGHEGSETGSRIRPVSAAEKEKGCRHCTIVYPEDNVVSISQKDFGFDKVFEAETQQLVLYDYVRPHIRRCFNGFNATILAYGQKRSALKINELRTEYCSSFSDRRGVGVFTQYANLAENWMPRVWARVFPLFLSPMLPHESIDASLFVIFRMMSWNTMMLQLWRHNSLNLTLRLNDIIPNSLFYSKWAVMEKVQGTSGFFGGILFSTGSGKTYTMGTGFNPIEREEEVGILPRAIQEIFSIMSEERSVARAAGLPEPEYQLGVQFIEVYQDSIRNLLAAHHTKALKRTKETKIMRQFKAGEVSSAEAVSVSTPEEVLDLLRTGCLNRTTGQTQMNASSSRSHAIFTLNLLMKKDKRLEGFKAEQQQSQSLSPVQVEQEDSEVKSSDSMNGSAVMSTSTSSESRSNGEGLKMEEEKQLDQQQVPNNEGFVTFVTKFTFVDLAGSERADRTQATGVTFHEGVSINTGLHHLGSVIASLARNADHIPYRNSKLTYILADAFGDSSQTLIMLQKENERLRKEIEDIREGRKIVIGNEIVKSDLFLESQVHMERIRDLEISNVAKTATIESLNRELAQFRLKAATTLVLSNASADFSSGEDGIGGLLQQQMEENATLRSKSFELQSAYDKLKEKFMNVANLRGFGGEDIFCNSVSIPNSASTVATNPSTSSSVAAENMGVAQAMAVLRGEVLEEMKNELVRARGSESGKEGDEEKADGVMTGSTSTENNGSSESSGDEEDSEMENGSKEADQEDQEIQQARGGAMRVHRQLAAVTTLINEVEMAGMRMTKLRDMYEKHIEKLRLEIANAGSKKSDVSASRPPPVPPSARTPKSQQSPQHSLKPSASVPAMPRSSGPSSLPSQTPPAARKAYPIRKTSSRSRVPPDSSQNTTPVHQPMGGSLSKSPSSASIASTSVSTVVSSLESSRVKALMRQLSQRSEEKKRLDSNLRDLSRKLSDQRKEEARMKRELTRKMEELKRLTAVEAEKMSKKFSGEIGQLVKIRELQNRKISKLEQEYTRSKEMLKKKENELFSTKKQVKELMIKRQMEDKRGGKAASKRPKKPATKESVWKEMSESLSEIAVKRGSTQALCQQLGVYMTRRNESYRSLEKFRTQRDETPNFGDKAALEARVSTASEEYEFFSKTIQEMNELIAAAEQIEYEHVTGMEEHYLNLMEGFKEPRFFMDQLMKKCVAQATALYLQNQKLADLKCVVEEHEKNIEMKQQLLEYLCHLHSDEMDAEDADGDDLPDLDLEADVDLDSESLAASRNRLWFSSSNTVRDNDLEDDNLDDQATVILGRSDSMDQLSKSLSSSSLSMLLPPPKSRQKTITVPELLFGAGSSDNSRPESPARSGRKEDEVSEDAYANPLSDFNRRTMAEEIAALAAKSMNGSVYWPPGSEAMGMQSMESSASSQASSLPSNLTDSMYEDKSTPSSRMSVSQAKNVFQRLSSVPGATPVVPTKGSVLPFVPSLGSSNMFCGGTRRTQSRFGSPSLGCEFVATGHAAAVKSICATEDLLLSGSKGKFAMTILRHCTVKVWDLKTMSELISFSHQRSVKCVKMWPGIPNTVIAAAGPLVRLWDLRSGVCTRTLTSQGLEWEPGTNSMTSSMSSSSGGQLTSSSMEEVTALEVLDSPNPVLFVAAGDRVRVWNLSTAVYYLLAGGGAQMLARLFECDVQGMSSLNHPFNKGVRCLAACACPDEDGISVATGCKDHIARHTGLAVIGNVSLLRSECLDDFLAHETGGVNDLCHNSSLVFSASERQVLHWLVFFNIVVIQISGISLRNMPESGAKKRRPDPEDPDTVMCKICFSLLDFPVEFPCGNSHYFCAQCLYKNLKIENNVTCPVCRIRAGAWSRRFGQQGKRDFFASIKEFVDMDLHEQIKTKFQKGDSGDCDSDEEMVVHHLLAEPGEVGQEFKAELERIRREEETVSQQCIQALQAEDEEEIQRRLSVEAADAQLAARLQQEESQTEAQVTPTANSNGSQDGAVIGGTPRGRSDPKKSALRTLRQLSLKDCVRQLRGKTSNSPENEENSDARFLNRSASSVVKSTSEWAPAINGALDHGSRNNLVVYARRMLTTVLLPVLKLWKQFLVYSSKRRQVPRQSQCERDRLLAAEVQRELNGKKAAVPAPPPPPHPANLDLWTSFLHANCAIWLHPSLRNWL